MTDFTCNAVSTLVGGVIGFFSANRVESLRARREAGNQLRAAFAWERAAIRMGVRDNGTTPNKDEVKDLLTSAFPKHAAAVEMFRHYVPKNRQDEYDEAWRLYWDVGRSVRFFDYYMGPAPGRLFEERVAAILAFTGKTR